MQSQIKNKLLLLWLALTPIADAKQLLTLEQVLASTQRHYPKAIAMKHAQDKASGDELSARGLFDLKVSLKAQTQPTGYYQNSEVISGLEQPTQLWGTRLFAGWRQGHGEFAPYEGKRLTGSDGEIVAGIAIPLLRGGVTDENRTQIALSEAGVQEANAQYKGTLLNALLVATVKYWKWIEKVQKLNILNGLLQNAEERQSWIETRVRLGDVPKLEATDNERTILDRKIKVANAEQELAWAALELSMYYRDEEGNPILVDSNEAPSEFPAPEPLLPNEQSIRTEKAFTLRPEFQSIRAGFSAVDTKVRLAENQLLPTLDLYGESSRDLGAVDATRDGTELKAGLILKIPLERRKAKGKLASARAERLKIESELRLVRDQIRVSVAQQFALLEATAEQIELARKEVDVSLSLVDGERVRFKQGDSHIMFVNIRELSLGGAKLRLVEARSKYQQALAALLMVTGELLPQ